jgi:hypothetical protein
MAPRSRSAAGAARLEENGLGLPPGAEWLDDLTVYAVPMRYDELLDVEPLDRDSVLALVDEVGAWAAGRLGADGI